MAGDFSPEQYDSLRLLVESVRDYAIFQLDPDGFVSTWNQGAERIKGYQASEIIGKHFSQFYPEADVKAGKCEMELEVAQREGRYAEEGWRVRKDGSLFWASVTITALYAKTNTLRGFAKVTRDMTERREQEEELRHARDSAEHANQAKTEFLSRISHELRTPLTAILGFAELLEMEGPRPDQKSHVEAILHAGNHLLDLLNEVLSISRIEQGRYEISLEPWDTKALLEEAVELIMPMANSRSIKITVETGFDVGIVADGQRFKQVLLNLLSNAVKYNQDHGSIHCRAMHKNGTVRVEIIDSGIGIAADNMGRLFEPFDRMGADRLGIEGTGLGLALSKRLVDVMGGQIGADSIPGAGTTFWVEMPSTDLREKPFAVVPHEAGSPYSDAQPISSTILYIEDNLANLRLIEGVLHHRPRLRLITALQGSIGLEMAQQQQPSLILLDIQLPDIRGEVVLDELKQNPKTSAIPVVVLTADLSSSRRIALLEAGASAFVSKPVRVAKLLQLVDEYVGDEAGGEKKSAAADSESLPGGGE